MRRFRTDDLRVLEHPPSAVFRALSDLEGYNRWWPRDVRFRVVQLIPALIGAKLEVLAFKRSFFAEIAKTDPDKSIVWTFRSGLYRGQGTWTLQEDEGRTRLRYVSDLPVHPSILEEHFADAKAFAGKHSKVLGRAFDGLERLLSEVRAR